jgi:hypothetical protein
VAWLGTFGLVTGLATTLYLAALRRRATGRTDWPAFLVVGGIGVLAVLAMSLQAFTYPHVLLGDRPGATDTPLTVIYSYAFRFARLGEGAAANVLLLLVLGVLGLAATALLVLSRLRVSVEPRAAEPASPHRTLGRVGAVGGLVLVLAVAGYALWPWLRAALTADEVILQYPGAGRALANTWLPSLLAALVGVGLAALAGFGIGALRPLGRWSELLLLPFGPWLFVGLGALGEAAYVQRVDLGLVNTFGGLVPPTALSIPALFLFTLVFRGERVAPSAMVRALPMVGVVFAAVWVGYANSTVWPLLVASDPATMTGPVLALSRSLMLFTTKGIGLASPPVLVLLLALGLAAAQVAYLDRLAIRTGAGVTDP